jgi:hypothetical protein
MPWLVKDKESLSEMLFFVHIPRCGGTSLMHHFDVPNKAMKGRSCWGKFGMKVFFNRYKLLESANFPMKTKGNAASLLLLGAGLYLIGSETLVGLGIFLTVASLVFIVCLSFLFTAPTIGRISKVRRCYLVFVHYILCRFMESTEWCTGTNKKGYMMHLTAHKLLAYGYVTPEEIERVCSLAIVRNPYSRMVSMYNYNKFGSMESFSHFVESWYNNSFYAYRTTGEMEEWWTPCHAIPQFEYTHSFGKQLVQSIVKQEELKFLKTKEGHHKAVEQDSTVSDLPDLVRDALLGMPHSNRRVTEKKWFEYYDQRTLDLTYEMYRKDFEVFDYSPILAQRKDLQPPAGYNEHSTTTTSSIADEEEGGVESVGCLEQLVRDSSKKSLDLQALRKSLLEQSATLTELEPNRFRSSMFSHSEIMSKTNPGNRRRLTLSADMTPETVTGCRHRLQTL